MARQAAVKIEKNFTNGLITESTALQFPENAAVETFNCIFDKTGRVTRRFGLDVEGSDKLTSIPFVAGDVISEFLWETVAGVSSKSFLVMQTGNLLRFYDVSTSTDITDGAHADVIDLDGLIPGGSSIDPAIHVCQFAAGNGDLIVVNRACQPFAITYSASGDEFSVNGITMEYRDLAGVDSGLAEIFTRFGGTTAGCAAANPSHYYNLHNQGWFTDPLDQWDTAFTDLPSNADVVATSRKDQTDSFLATHVTASANFPSTAAPRGHFLLDVFAPDRVDACNTEAAVGITSSAEAPTLIPKGDGTIVTDLDTNPEYCFDGSVLLYASSSGAKLNFYAGKNFGAGTKRRVDTCYIIGRGTHGYLQDSNPTITASLRGSNTLPTDWAADGDELGSDTATDASYLQFGIESSDKTTFYQWVWFYISSPSGSDFMYCADNAYYEPPIETKESLSVVNMSTYERPRATAFYAGRVWYAGIDDRRRSSNIYYSQLVLAQEDYGKVHQANDPTGEDIFDLLATDGGYINTPDIGTVIKLYVYQDSLLVFSNKGIWQVKGGSAGFSATDFIIRKISSLGTVSANSIVDVQGSPVFWAENGIYSVSYDFENDSFQAKSLTDDKIKTFITDIPEYNRAYVKGSYDVIEQRLTFLYNTSTTLAADNDEFEYTAILNMDLRTGAFYPWTIGANDLDIVGIIYIRAADRSSPSITKYVTTLDVDASNRKIGFSEIGTTNYLDWQQHAIDVGDDTQVIDYTSYFEAGYYVHSDGDRYFQPNYVTVFMETEDTAALQMNAIFDFSTDASSGRHSTLQACYNDCGSVNLSFRSISMKKLKVRGRGRSVSLRFESQSERPFTLIGWTANETSNAAL